MLKITKKFAILFFVHAGVAELADALDLGSSVNRCAGSSPVTRIYNESVTITDKRINQ